MKNCRNKIEFVHLMNGLKYLISKQINDVDYMQYRWLKTLSELAMCVYVPIKFVKTDKDLLQKE